MSLLPGQILPADTPIGQLRNDGSGLVTINHDYWLLLYNLCLQTLGTGGGLPADALIDLESADMDAADADAIALRQGLANALLQVMHPSDVVPGLDDLPDLQRALLLAQDPLLPDAVPRAPPASAITPTGSPFTYTAAFDGILIVTGGTVSALALIRQGTSIALGITTGPVPLSRLDAIQVTYSGAPTMNFLPR